MRTTTRHEIPDGKGLSLEKLWEYLHASSEKFEREMAADKERFERERAEFDERMKKSAERFDREMAASKEKADREMAELRELAKENKQMLKENERLIGGLGNSFGQLAEHLVAPGIAGRFNELGYHFGSISPGGMRIFGENRNVLAEIDLLLENGENIVAVEVKARPREGDIKQHVRRLEILREYRNRLHDERKIMGAIAGAIFGVKEQEAALQAGLYVLEQSGDTMKINIPEGFVPREW
jgi:hypothetical protein